MKKSILILLVTIFLVACGGTSENKKAENQEQQTSLSMADASVVNVYYFHGKQRCKTCIAVGDVTKNTISSFYAGNDKVIFTEVDTSDKQYEDLVNKYEVSWNALIIAKGDNSVDITEQAFGYAVGSPETLRELIQKEVNQRIEL